METVMGRGNVERGDVRVTSCAWDVDRGTMDLDSGKMLCRGNSDVDKWYRG